MKIPYSTNSRWLNLKTVSLFAVTLLVATVTLLVNFAEGTSKIVHSSSSTSHTDQKRGLIGTSGWELFPSTSDATSKFNELLEGSNAYQEFTPCFNDRGKLIGNRAVISMPSQPSVKASWKIVWTEQRADFSKLYYTESDSLDNARELENNLGSELRLCRTTK